MDSLENVEDLTSLWNFDLSYDDVTIRKQLQHVTEELAEARKEASKQAKINKEIVKKLIHLLGIAYKERDEAKARLRKLSPSSLPLPPPPPTATTTTNVSGKSGLKGNNTTLPTNPQQQPIRLSINPTWDLRSSEAKTPPTIMSPSNRSPLMMNNNNINSGMSSHSNTLSSSLDSYFDVGSSLSPESFNLLSKPNYASSSYDTSGTLLLDMLAEGRPLLDDSLFAAGSLPKWMNPPQAPPVPISLYKRARYNESLDH